MRDETQYYRYLVHKYLDAIWTVSSKKYNARTSMYKWLSAQMNLDKEKTHIRYFTLEQCKQAIEILKPKYLQLSKNDTKREEKVIMKVTRRKEFEAAHRLPDYDGACNNLHGHSYKVEVTVEGPINEETGMVIDFKDLDKAIKAVMPDHKYLHYVNDPFSCDLVRLLDKYGLAHQTFETKTTAENMSKWFQETLQDYLQNELGYGTLVVSEVKLWETTNSHSTYEV